MTIYLDTSALVKLVQRQTESAPLRGFLQARSGVVRLTSALSRVELVRAVAPGGPRARAHGRRLLTQLHVLDVTREVLDDAADLTTVAPLRSLDAIHLASALQVGGALSAVVTYDLRMAAAALELGLFVEAPS